MTMRVVMKLGNIRHVSENAAFAERYVIIKSGDFLLAEKPGDFVRNQLELWAAVGKPWVWVSSLALSSIGGAFSD